MKQLAILAPITRRVLRHGASPVKAIVPGQYHFVIAGVATQAAHLIIYRLCLCSVLNDRVRTTPATIPDIAIDGAAQPLVEVRRAERHRNVAIVQKWANCRYRAV